MRNLTLSLLLITLCGFSASLKAQSQFMTRTGHLYVKSTTNIIDIEADNYQVVSTLNTQTGENTFAALIKSFEFDLALANRAFTNERIDVKQFPKVEFKGKITNLKDVNFSRPGQYPIQISGWLTVWDEARWTGASGTLKVENGKILGSADFILTLEDQSIDKINRILREHIPQVVDISANDLGVSKKVRIKVNMTYLPQ
jgi:hypothetical protein